MGAEEPWTQVDMLSISLPIQGAARGNYYLDLAQEDYYLEGGEPPGKWHGQGALGLGLSGVLNKGVLRSLFAGFSPDGTTALVQNAGAEKRIMAWDLVFSPPKSVSVAWSQAEPKLRLAIQEAVERSAKRALDYLEEGCALTRRGSGGTTIEHAKAIFALFEHGTSRAQDPQLHIHALLLNIGLREDDTFGSLFSREFFRHKLAAGALFRVALAYECSLLGFGIDRDGEFFKLRAVSDTLCEEFSKRAKEIAAYMAKHGLEGAIAAKHAAVVTRQKKGHVAREKLFQLWQETGRQIGWSTQELNACLQASSGLPEPDLDGTKASVLRKINNRRREYFSEYELVQFVAEEGQARGLKADDVFSVAKDIIQEEGIALFPRRGEPIFTTRSHFEKEQRKRSRFRPDDSGEGGSPHADSRADHQTISKGPADHQTISKGPADHQTISKGPADHQTTSKGPADHQTTSKGPADHQTIPKEPADTQPLNRRWRLADVFEVRYIELFPRGWGEIKHFTVPFIAIPFFDKNPRYGETLWQKKTPVGSLKVREMIIFPDAPKWSVFHGWKSPVIKFYPDRDPLGLKRALSELVHIVFKPATGDFQRGDRVYFLRGIKILGIKRGSLGMIKASANNSLKILIENGPLRIVPSQFWSRIRHKGRRKREAAAREYFAKDRAQANPHQGEDREEELRRERRQTQEQEGPRQSL